ncbi:hypothetical protein KAR91_66480 [Candidatus Pacearchaeota archaeon]|nr:hypothetical protein [Candidatus Pacearchaeota archaeon]
MIGKPLKYFLFFMTIFLALYVGVIMGFWLSSAAYKPLVKSQANELKATTEAKHRLEGRIKYLTVEISSHVQDMEYFKKTSTLYIVLKGLGVDKYLENIKNETMEKSNG